MNNNIFTRWKRYCSA